MRMVYKLEEACKKPSKGSHEIHLRVFGVFLLFSLHMFSQSCSCIGCSCRVTGYGPEGCGFDPR